jgi:hypothetical protein
MTRKPKNPLADASSFTERADIRRSTAKLDIFNLIDRNIIDRTNDVPHVVALVCNRLAKLFSLPRWATFMIRGNSCFFHEGDQYHHIITTMFRETNWVVEQEFRYLHDDDKTLII